eukprot:7629538-Pyramimonas_sp.AAC.1
MSGQGARAGPFARKSPGQAQKCSQMTRRRIQPPTCQNRTQVGEEKFPPKNRRETQNRRDTNRSFLFLRLGFVSVTLMIHDT